MSASPVRPDRPAPRPARRQLKPDEAIATFVRILEQLEAGLRRQATRAGR
ncbi:hypothetical protein [Chelatococcus asaccharovorans]|mgnify:CR=1 FL=1|uniref:Uncharacterized protein n=1 Tax=Chelatococcus asaccharovorans TaxID=28210 RepID=A0A2V3U1V6_9HYPH|nr:hypothetical protein [Chelatococcus asaccharovorans]PXW56279.1 hypothetical protein C7450_10828 [Chelatococcus asaccharovorans]